MMPILDLQRRVTEVGRIRLGTSTPRKGGGKIPKRLETWRLTSSDETRIRAAAEALGGTPQPWKERPGHFEVVTQTDRLSVILIPGQNLSQWWELWGPPKPKSANVCLRRCDGREMVGGFELGRADVKPCACPKEFDVRREQATKGKACKPYTRLSVILRDVEGFGAWRLETAGINAALELAGATPILERVTTGGALVPAFLRIDWRTDQVAKADGTTEGRRYPVAVLDIAERIDRIAELAGGRPADELTAGDDRDGYRALPSPARVTVSDGIEAAARAATPASTSARAAAAIGPAAAVPTSGDIEGSTAEPEPDFGDGPPPASTAEIVEGEATEAEPPVGEPLISDAQRDRLWTIIRNRGVPEADVREILRDVTGQESTKAITRALYDVVVSTVQSRKVEP